MTADLRERLRATLGGAYVLERELGGGGMSRVFAAEETSLGRRVVLKVLPPELAAEVSAERFRREISFAAQLRHPLIVPLLSAGEANGLLYYTMPYVEGESLRARLAREGALPARDAVRILREVADALAHAHSHGLVHRDIKPENILLEGNHALVADFGVAKALVAATGEAATATGTGILLGTPAYMAPEQAAGDPAADHRVDIYALGLVAYEMLAGHSPFAGRSPRELIAAHMVATPAPLAGLRPDLPPSLATLVMRCLAKSPGDRPQSAEEVLRELDALTTGPGSVQHAGRPPRRLGRVAAYVGVPAAVLLVGAALIARQLDESDPGRFAAVKSVAVLPFANLSPDRENEYFADGMTEELLNALTKVEGLRVPARTSSFAFKGKNLGVRAVADSLRVGAVLEGSVRRAGDRLKVTAQLINAADGYHLWSETYEREAKDVFAVQEEIARAIVSALRVQLTGRAAGGDIVRQPTANLEAYELYLKGRFAWNQRTASSIEKAIQYFQQAIARDSNFALAYAGLADAYAILPTYAYVPVATTHRQAEASALRALQLDSMLAEAHATLGTLRIDDYDWAGGEQAYRRAIALNPRYATAHHWYALLLMMTGRLGESRAAVARATALDPLSRVIGIMAGIQLFYERDYDAAVAQYHKVLELDPTFGGANQYLGYALAQQGKFAEALAETERAAAAMGWRPALRDAYVGHVYALAGEREQARRRLGDLLRRSRSEYVPEDLVGLIYAALGDSDSAFVWLEKALDAKPPDLAYIKVDPRFDPLRKDPRYARLLARLNLKP